MEPLVRVAVSGEVTRPRVFAVRPETTIGEAVARAGGVTQDGAREPRPRPPARAQRQAEAAVLNLSRSERHRAARCRCAPATRSSWIAAEVVREGHLLPTLGVIGSVASLGLLIDRVSRRTNRPTQCPLLPPQSRAARPVEPPLRADRSAPRATRCRSGQMLKVVRRRFAADPRDHPGGRADRPVPGLAGAAVLHPRTAMLRLAGERRAHRRRRCRPRD